MEDKKENWKKIRDKIVKDLTQCTNDVEFGRKLLGIALTVMEAAEEVKSEEIKN